MSDKTEVQTYDTALELIEEKDDGTLTLGDTRVSAFGPGETLHLHPDEKRVSVIGYGSFEYSEDGSIWPANLGARRLTDRRDWTKNRKRLTALVSHALDLTGPAAYHDRKPVYA